MASIGKWVKLGDRSHPNLKLIDEGLMHKMTYSGHEEDLRELEAFHFSGDQLSFERTLHKIRESQKLSKGDRSHQRLKKLDALRPTLTYDGWEQDFNSAEREHVNNHNGYDFNIMIRGMARKQAMHVGDRTHKNLQFLDSLSLSYPGWKDDVKSAMEMHEKGYVMNNDRYCITERQRIFEGDRSHPRLVALDSLKLTYPGWKLDVKMVEENHASWFFSSVDGIDSNYGALLELLKRKQREFVTGVEDTSSMNPIQRKIVETHWTYPGFEADVREAKESYCVCLFKKDLERCQLRQMIHEKDFGHHPALIELEDVRRDLSYPGHQTDAERAKDHLLQYGYTFYAKNYHEMIEGMKNKQNAYNGLAGKVPTKTSDVVSSRAIARAPTGSGDVVPSRAIARAPTGSGSMRFLRRLNFAMSRRSRRSKTQQSERPLQSENQFGCCSICLDAPRTHVFVPCGHMCACKPCSQKLMKKGGKCPLCTQTATSVMEVFLP